MPPTKYNFLDFAEEILSGVPKRITFQEIWDLGKERGPGQHRSVSTSTSTPSCPAAPLAARAAWLDRSAPPARRTRRMVGHVRPTRATHAAQQWLRDLGGQ